MSGRHSRYPAVNRDVPPSSGRHLDGDTSEPEAEPVPEAVAAPEPAPAPEPEPTPEPETEPVEEDGYPEDGSVATVLEWVGDDADRSDIALAAELEREKPRKGILDALAG